MARILAIDDDPEVHPLLRVTLAKLGHQTTMAASGEDGLALAFHQSQAFDLVLLDLMMPGLDGYEVARRLRADPRTRHLPIVVLTARTQAADHAEALESGADGFLPKPFDPVLIRRKIDEVLATAAARRTSPLGRLPPAAASARVTLLLGLRGGVGATTCAVNLAGALVLAGRRVCLLELTTTGGHAAFHLRLPTSLDWSSLSSAGDAAGLGPLLLQHESGLAVLAAPAVPVRRGLSTDLTHALLGELGSHFDHLLIDAAPVLDDATWTAIGAADRTVVLCSPEVGSIQTAVGALGAVESARKPAGGFHVGICHVSPEAGVPAGAVERALGRAPDLVVPFDRLQARAMAQGAPLVFAQPAAALAAAIGAYAVALLEQQPVAQS